MAYVVGVVIFAFGLLFSVCLHEAGHMGVAKALGMRVSRYFVASARRSSPSAGARPSTA